MKPPTTAESDAAAIDWDEERWSAARGYLGDLVEHVPGDDAPLDDRTRTVDFACQRAVRLAAAWPTGAPSARARALLEAMHEVRLREPRALPDPKPPPQAVVGLARLASELVANPAAAASIDPGLAPALDRVLGAPVLAQYVADIEDARERLASACEELLGRLPTTWRVEAGAPNRAEREQMEAARAATGTES